MKVSGGYDMLHVRKAWEEKCMSEGGSAVEKFRFNLERKEWALGWDYGEEGITIKYLFDQDTKTHFVLTEALLDFECEWTFRQYQDHAMPATTDWCSDMKEYKIIQRLTGTCWVTYQVTEPKLGGLFASRDMILLTYFDKIEDTHFVSFRSTEWPGLEPRDGVVRATVQEGSGISLSPDARHKATRTRLRWISTLDFKLPFVPNAILRNIYADGCRKFILALQNFLSKHRMGLQVIQG
ncbi:unnamed protein product [Darwinula stevensoni]|uniref:START domain-containing protein n=1 Tax=Darwinula stevensoni TaxID=69355 RepID=A0A7R8XJS2_9CRUS|nr:unnamed protein product [Darwinula stevensoni]CAG0892505.1 unnamed protein product [Darwinula stevensoni]